MKCEVPPEGWACSRPAGHDGPCAASPSRNEERMSDECSKCGYPNDGGIEFCSVAHPVHASSEPRPENPVPATPEPERNPYRSFDQIARDEEHQRILALLDSLEAHEAVVNALMAAVDTGADLGSEARAAITALVGLVENLAPPCKDTYRAERDAAIAAGQKLADCCERPYSATAADRENALAAWRSVSGSSEPRKENE